MFATLLAGALLSMGAHPDPCAKTLSRGPAVPAPLVLSTDCGWFRLEADGAVSRLPIDWLANQNREWRRRHGDPLTLRRTRSGRYLVVRSGRVIWRSAGLYYNDGGDIAFGPGVFGFSTHRRGLFLTDLNSPERLVLAKKGTLAGWVSPLAFLRNGQLVVTSGSRILVLSPSGAVLARLRYRPSSGYSFDERTETLYFVSRDGMLSAAHGSVVRRIRRISAQGSISVLGRRLLTVTGTRHAVVLRRDGSLVARASWRGARSELDAGVVTTDDGKLFAFRVSNSRPGRRRSTATVYVLRAGEGHARVVYRHRMGQAGCGSGASLSWHGSSLLYRSADGTGVAEAAVLAPSGSNTRLTPLLRALPRISPATPGNAAWAAAFAS